MSFLQDYIATRHPNSPRQPEIATYEADLALFEDQAALSMIEHINALYCLREGIIQPADLPCGMVSI